jgi:hypothetical protein
VALDATTLAQIRDWVGSTPDDDTIEATFGRADTGTADLTALAILKKRRADLLANPTAFELVGDYREDRGKNLEALNAQIAELAALCGIGPDVVTTADADQVRRPLTLCPSRPRSTPSPAS